MFEPMFINLFFSILSLGFSALLFATGLFIRKNLINDLDVVNKKLEDARNYQIAIIRKNSSQNIYFHRHIAAAHRQYYIESEEARRNRNRAEFPLIVAFACNFFTIIFSGTWLVSTILPTHIYEITLEDEIKIISIIILILSTLLVMLGNRATEKFEYIYSIKK